VRIHLRIPPPPASIPPEDVVVLFPRSRAIRHLLSREAQRLVIRGGAGPQRIDVPEWLVFGAPEDGRRGGGLEDGGAEVVGEGVAEGGAVVVGDGAGAEPDHVGGAAGGAG